MIEVAIDEASPVPPFEQLRVQLDAVIRSGALAPGTQLPTVRQLAGDLGLAPNTVARAYRALEEADLVVAGGRRGTRVRDPAELSTARRAEMVGDAVRRYLADAARLGLSPEEALAALGRAVPGRPDGG